MELQLRWDAEATLILACSGQIGWEAVDMFTREVAEAFQNRACSQVLVNLEAVDFVNSAGIGALIQLRKLVEERSGRIAIACAAPMIANLFATVGLDRHIPMFQTLAEARNGLENSVCVVEKVQ